MHTCTMADTCITLRLPSNSLWYHISLPLRAEIFCKNYKKKYMKFMYSVLIQICRCYSAKTVVLEHQRSMNFIEKKHTWILFINCILNEIIFVGLTNYSPFTGMTCWVSWSRSTRKWVELTPDWREGSSNKSPPLLSPLGKKSSLVRGPDCWKELLYEINVLEI